jgi:hypothetical protein
MKSVPDDPLGTARLEGIVQSSGCMARKKPRFDAKKEVRAIARERIGTVPASRAIEPKQQRKKPKHKPDWLEPHSIPDSDAG